MVNEFDRPEISTEASLLLHYLSTERSRDKITPERPITGQKLATLLGTSERDIQSQIEELRNAGELIGVGHSLRGYFFAIDLREMEPFVRNVKSRIGKLSATLHAVEATCRKSQLALSL